MYVLKKLNGVSAVQTLSRLNRICPPYDKKTFILDFVNTYEDIVGAFRPYYTTTLLANSVTPSAVYDLEAKLDGYYILDPIDIERAAELLYSGDAHAKTRQKLNFYFDRAKKKLEEYDVLKQLDLHAGLLQIADSLVQKAEALHAAAANDDDRLFALQILQFFQRAFSVIQIAGQSKTSHNCSPPDIVCKVCVMFFPEISFLVKILTFYKAFG